MTKNTEINALNFGKAGAVVSAGGMILLTLTAKAGLYVQAATQMMNWHMFYSLNLLGTITGAIEAAVIGFIFAYAFAWVYNYFLK